jgi:hypothetical protein
VQVVCPRDSKSILQAQEKSEKLPGGHEKVHRGPVRFEGFKPRKVAEEPV